VHLIVEADPEITAVVVDVDRPHVRSTVCWALAESQLRLDVDRLDAK
jgi:hypothetical protein